MAKKNHHPVSAEVENNPLYHDTYKLLRCYRDSTYSLMVAVRQVEIQFQLEYNTSVDEFLDSIYAAGADLGDSQIEEWAKSIARSNKMIKLLLSSVDLLRKNHKHGEEYYWILYYAFLSPHELKNEYSCAMKSHFRKFGNQMSGSGNHLCNYASLLA